jgi:hypothetical protein
MLEIKYKYKRRLPMDQEIEDVSRKIIKETTGSDPENPRDEEIVATIKAADELSRLSNDMTKADDENRTNGDREPNEKDAYEKD